MMERKKLLLLTDWFDPAFKAGGPITSCVNLVKTYGRFHDIYVLTTDKDIDNTIVIPFEKTNKWVPYINGAKVWYCGSEGMSLGKLKRMIEEVAPETVYCNSMFSKTFTIYPLILKRLGKINSRLVLAPRGMLKNSALSFKKRKKQLFLKLLRQAGIGSLIHFQATDQQELEDVKRAFGEVRVSIVGNLPSPISEQTATIPKNPGELKVLFLGRIHPIKQLNYLLNSLKHVDGMITLNIVGPLEDIGYWDVCKEIIQTLPPTVEVTYMGEKNPELLPAIIRAAHIMSLPTKGENFGHAIYETLANSRPVLISNKTPWRNLEIVKAGYDIDLNNTSAFISALQHLIDMDFKEYTTWCEGALALARNYLAVGNSLNEYDKLFFSHES